MAKTAKHMLRGSRRSTPKRKRKRVPTALELAARRSNLLKARAAPKEIIYRPTAKRRAASLANIQKAIAVRKTPEGNLATRLNALKHGLFAHRIEDSVARLGESREEFRAHLRLFERFYIPEDDLEKKLVRRLAETTWRRLRLFRAQARWEADRLKQVLAQAPSAEKLTVEEAERRAYALLGIIFNYDQLFQEAMKVHSQVERALRALLRKKSGGKIEFKVLSPRRESRIPELDEPSIFDLINTIEVLRDSKEGRELLQRVGNRK